MLKVHVAKATNSTPTHPNRVMIEEERGGERRREEERGGGRRRGAERGGGKGYSPNAASSSPPRSDSRAPHHRVPPSSSPARSRHPLRMRIRPQPLRRRTVRHACAADPWPTAAT